MNKHLKNNRRINILLVLSIIGLAIIIGWFILQQKSSSPSQSSVSDSSTTASYNNVKQEKLVSLIEANLPEEWSVEMNEPQRILLSNATSKCYADVTNTTDTAESNSAEVDQFKQTTDAIESKGYTIEETTGVLTINTDKGEKQIDAQVLKISGLDNPMFQNYAYITTNKRYTVIQLSCPNEADIQTAKNALSAIQLEDY